jgi:hypothetical protein
MSVSTEIKLFVGEFNPTPNWTVDTLREVRFRGYKVTDRREVTDSRGFEGIDQTLYKTDDDRWIVYCHRWSKWQGATEERWLVEAQPEDLEPNGRFEMLAREAHLCRPLTLDDALSKRNPDE